MLRINRLVFISTLALSLLWLAGCAAPVQTPVAPPLKNGALFSGLQLTGMSTAIGAAPEGPNRQVVTYHATLFNPGPNPVTLAWVQPKVKDALAQRVDAAGLRQAVGQTIPPNSPLVVDGSFSFDATGLSKADIDAIGSPFSQLTISTEQTLALEPAPTPYP